MTPQEIKHIICTFVDYGWPWQWLATNGEWVTASDQSLDNLLDEMVTQPHARSDNRLPPYVRLDPSYEHDWPIEQREVMPVWALFHGPYRNKGGRWFRFDSIEHARDYADGQIGVHSVDDIAAFVAPNPLKPNEPPPLEWSPEGRRVLI